jgi:hypothetical protein
MNPSRLSIAVLATLFSISATATSAAIVDASEPAPNAKEPRVVEINTETFVSNDAGVFIAQANDTPTLPLAALPPDIDTIVSTSLSEAFAGLSAHSTSRIIKNAPYSAEIISERVQMLADGNQIVKRTSQMSYRDALGRTRIETQNADGTLRNINIFDAFEGSRYILNPMAKSATKLTTDANFRQRIEAMREKAKSAAKDIKSTVIAGGTPGEKVIIHRVEGVKDSAIDGGSDDIKINVIRSDGSEPMSIKSGSSHMLFNGRKSSISIGGINPGSTEIMSSLLGAPFQDREWSKKATTKELGFRDFNGVRAEGKLRSYTIPAGEIGNKNAITVSTETWVSPELQITVYSKHSDPRAGDNVYRLANISRNEQPVALFTVPDGYNVKAVQMPSISVKSK